jgi:DNA-binding PadR family transcriptional regulator
MRSMSEQLAQSEFYILLSLAIRPRHGYEIMKQVEQDSGGRVVLGPGTLYGSIKRMLQAGLIEVADGEHPRRKYYRISEQGRRLLSAELDRYHSALELARRENLYKPIRPSEPSL